MRYTTIFIDFDDTLIDTQGYANLCLTSLYADYKLDSFFSSVEEFVNLYHLHVGELWRQYALGYVTKEELLKSRFDKTLGGLVDRDFLNRIGADFVSRVIKNDIHIEGAEDLLKYLKSRYTVVMLSNGFSEMQYDKIRNVGFMDYFDDVVLSDVVGVNKPHPDIFTFALRKMNVKSEKVVMIGDSYLSDIKGAMNSHIDQIWYNPLGLKEDVMATYTVKKLDEICDIL